MPITKRNWVHVPTLEEYEKTFGEYFHFKRENGILEVRMHYENGPVVWSYQMHHAITELWTAIGHDRENEVLIFTATGDKWIAQYDEGSFHEFDTKPTSDRFNVQIYDTMKIVENFVNDVNIPTITAFNGPGLHWEMGIMSDIALCTPDFVIRDDHFLMPPGHVPGDGMFMALQTLIGPKRAAAVEYMGVEYMGGGISTSAHCKGRIVDMNADDEGTFSPERPGRVPCSSLVDLCYSGEYTYKQAKKLMRGQGGLVAYLGTNSAVEVEEMIADGDLKAKLIYEAMGYQISKDIAAMAAAMSFKVDRIIMTGGIAHSKMLTDMIKERVEKIAPVEIIAGSFEMEALAAGTLRVLRGEEQAKRY